MAQVVLDHNEDHRDTRINIRGIAVGDPLIDNKYQYATYASTLYSMGLLLEDERAEVEAIMKNASALNDVDCLSSFKEWNRVWNDDGGSSCHPHCEFLFKAFTGSENTENLLLGAQPENFGYFRSFLAQHEAEFHVEGRPDTHSTLQEGGKVYLAMVKSGDFCESTAPLYASLFLSGGLDVLVYSSNLDPLLGPPATAAGIQAAWDYAEKALQDGADSKDGFYRQRKNIWKVAMHDVEPAGYSRCLSGESGRFCYVIVRNAGHETAPYAPRAAHNLNERFLHGLPFDSREWPQVHLPTCAACGGAPPLAGSALAACTSTAAPEASVVVTASAAVSEGPPVALCDSWSCRATQTVGKSGSTLSVGTLMVYMYAAFATAALVVLSTSRNHCASAFRTCPRRPRATPLLRS
ncbi:unnamed protein product [Polarella glacialis]|nr:unnamed protein product [Polarella glacialis]